MSTIYRPKKRKYPQNDPFFEEGNVALRAFWLRKEATSQAEIEMITEQTDNVSSKYTMKIYCEDCAIELPTVATYELHYEAVHRNVCTTCCKTFPGSEWLQLHLDEWHDMFLQIKRERGEPIHRCFVSSCKDVFISQHTRQRHLIEKHQYPTYFPFDLVETGTLTIEERKFRQVYKHTMDDLIYNVSNLKLPPFISFGNTSVPFSH